ncbi:MAG: hypothetical protein P8R38_07875 [Planctomycetota bacterium]|nr:hypothetical protein [Planctomycetota bacterium]
MSSENNTGEGDSKVFVRLSFGVLALLLINMGQSSILKLITFGLAMTSQSDPMPGLAFLINVVIIISGLIVLMRSLSMKS